MPYVLWLERREEHNGRLYNRWLGGVNKVFNTVEEACIYFDTHNPHMRPITPINPNSDWDPVMNIRYVVRQYNGTDRLTILPW